MNKNKELLSADEISFSYGKKLVFNNLNFQVSYGECVGIIGRNGCGKTTLLKLLSGLTHPQKGNIKIVTRGDDNTPAIAGFLESPKLFEYLSGDENLRFCLEKQYSAEKVEKALKLWELDKFANVLVRKYSLGMKQKLGIIISFISEAPLLIFDEPTNSLDFKSVETFFYCVNEYVKSGRSVIIVTHLLYGLKQNCSRILKIEDGKLDDLKEETTCNCYTIEFSNTENASLASTCLAGSEIVSLQGNMITINENQRSISEILRLISVYDVVTISRCNDLIGSLKDK